MGTSLTSSVCWYFLILEVVSGCLPRSHLISPGLKDTQWHTEVWSLQNRVLSEQPCRGRSIFFPLLHTFLCPHEFFSPSSMTTSLCLVVWQSLVPSTPETHTAFSPWARYEDLTLCLTREREKQRLGALCSALGYVKPSVSPKISVQSSGEKSVTRGKVS